jgi:hypothetical protein
MMLAPQRGRDKQMSLTRRRMAAPLSPWRGRWFSGCASAHREHFPLPEERGEPQGGG